MLATTRGHRPILAMTIGHRPILATTSVRAIHTTVIPRHPLYATSQIEVGRHHRASRIGASVTTTMSAGRRHQRASIRRNGKLTTFATPTIRAQTRPTISTVGQGHRAGSIHDIQMNGTSRRGALRRCASRTSAMSRATTPTGGAESHPQYFLLVSSTCCSCGEGRVRTPRLAQLDCSDS